MTTGKTEESSVAERSPTGVYYYRSDYAGFGRRFLIVVVDSIVCLVAGILVVLGAVLAWGGREPPLAVLLGWLAFLWLYLAAWKASPFPTLGYLLLGVRLVNMRGERPSILRTTFRLLLWIWGPVHPLVDFVWLAADPNRQTLRDRFAATYVIRKGAQPAGRGRITLVPYFFWGFTLFFREVQREDKTPSPAAAADLAPARTDPWSSGQEQVE